MAKLKVFYKLFLTNINREKDLYEKLLEINQNEKWEPPKS
jgi:hypothetical protein